MYEELKKKIMEYHDDPYNGGLEPPYSCYICGRKIYVDQLIRDHYFICSLECREIFDDIPIRGIEAVAEDIHDIHEMREKKSEESNKKWNEKYKKRIESGDYELSDLGLWAKNKYGDD